MGLLAKGRCGFDMVQFAGILEKLLIHREKSPALRRLIYAVYLIPPVGAAVFTWHEMTHTEMVWSSTEITKPHDAYQSDQKRVSWIEAAGSWLAGEADDERHWSPKDAYKTAFLNEFSKDYFGRASRFGVFSEDMRRPSLTVILKNDASSRSLLVNSVSVIAVLEDQRPFDWRAVDVSTNLAIEASDWDASQQRTPLLFINDGIGPILKLNADISTDQGFPLLSLTQEEPIETQIRTFLWAQQPGYVGPRPDSFHGGLTTPLYRIIGDDEIIDDGWDVIDCASPEPEDYRCNGVVPDRYENIITIARLEALTEIQRANAINVDYSFEDLKNEAYAGQQTAALPTPIYWYRFSDDLLYRLPTNEPQSMKMLSRGDFGLPTDTAARAGTGIVDLAKAFFGVSKEGPKGVGLIKAELDIEAASIPECGFARAIAEPRTLLQGGGYVSVSLGLDSPKNGRYRLRFLINGEERHALSLDLMAPEQMHFDGNAETTRFTSYEDKPASPCAASPDQEPDGE